jgi:UDP-N-acetylmuramoyl-L-alanyl-D-glutamate--2,6-diaminopimelate ligase
MRLHELIASEVPGVGADAEITALAYDSRQVAPGALFFCVSGYSRDGHEFAEQAVRDGAVALVVERPLDLGVPEIRVSSVRAAMGPVAARFYGYPSAELGVVGVTGTNGKTTTAFLLRALLEASGQRCGLLGTVKSVVAASERPVARTTPEAIDLQADLRAMLDGGDRWCAMEVSSHALQLGRVDGVTFAAAIFTNLTQDHLDFHADMEDYFQAKRRLFGALEDPASGQAAPAGVRVVNVADRYGRRLAAEDPGMLTYAVDDEADYQATDVRCGLAGSRFTLHVPRDRSTIDRSGAIAREVELPLPGRFNVANALGALAAAHALGVDLDVLVSALRQGVRVPGRMEAVDEGQGFAVVVDYAHTPDSLENVLRAAGEATGPDGRVLCVFGAGGDRDRGKRPLMGEIAARLADVVVITSDNPRSEDPDEIIAQILKGAERTQRPVGASPVQSEVDRRLAVHQAIAAARAGDVVLVAGKGHEQGQEFDGGRKLPFDDVTVAREALRARGAEAVA